MDASPHQFTPDSIHRDTPIPLHYQLTELLSQEIEAGRWALGERIPTEEELCDQFRLSRTTVRKAMDALVNQGRLNREKGRGTFVAKPKLVEEFVNRPVGFYEDMLTRGIQVCNATCELQLIQPSAAIAKELDLRPGEAVIKIDRLRCIDNRPILFVTSYLPYAACPDLLKEDLTKTGLYTVLHDKFGFKIVRARRFVESVAANKYEAEKLKIKRGAPLLLVDSTVYLDDGRPIEYYKARHRGDRTRLIVESFTYDGK